MDPANPSHVREIGSIRPQLRSSLRFIFQEFAGERSCVIEDPLTSKFHRVGLAEYRFLRHLDGSVTFAEAFARASLESGAGALNEREAVALLSWLVENRLADLGGGVPLDFLEKTRGGEIRAKLKNLFNVLFIKVPLGRPDGLIDRAYPLFKFALGWGFFVLWFVVAAIGATQVALNWERFVRGTEGVLAPNNWLWLMLVWVGLKAWHEGWHALVCKHHGGQVREAGVMFVLFAPMGYVDATASLAFRSKWRRMHVAAAGVYGELFLAAIAGVVWAHTGPGITNTIAMNVMVMASTVTLLFNLNPLMKFDGYFIFIDLLEKPNLSTRATQLVNTLAKKWLLGVKLASPAWDEGDTWLWLAYGLASLVWRVLIFITLLIGASMLFRGGGLVLAFIALLFWAVPLLYSLGSVFKKDQAGEPAVWWPALWRCTLAAAVLVAVAVVPFRVAIKAPGVIEAAHEVILRAEGPGFLTAIHARDGDVVKAGAPLVTLENPELELQLQDLAIEHRRQDLKRRMLRLDSPVAEYEAEMAVLASLRKQYLEQLGYVETLDITATQGGRVVAPQLPRMRGRYLRTGDEIVRLVDPAAVEILIPISQDDVDYFRRHLGHAVEVYFEGRLRTGEGKLQRISGRAVTSMEHPALTTLAGGPLAVKPRGGGGGGGGGESDAYELAQPYFWGAITLPEDAAADIRPGERVRVKFRSEQYKSLGTRARDRVVRFIDHVFAQAEDAAK